MIIAQRRYTIRRPSSKAAAVKKDGPNANRDILAEQVQLIDASGQNLGVVNTRTALAMAQEAGLDLIEIVPTATPPVCKITDLGKLKYQTQKKAAIARKNQKTVEVKEIKLRPNIDSHDYDVKLRAILRFLSEGDKVKVTMRFRGREMAHQDLGEKLLSRITQDVGDNCKIEFAPKMEGRQMIMILAPK